MSASAVDREITTIVRPEGDYPLVRISPCRAALVAVEEAAYRHEWWHRSTVGRVPAFLHDRANPVPPDPPYTQGQEG